MRFEGESSLEMAGDWLLFENGLVVKVWGFRGRVSRGAIAVILTRHLTCGGTCHNHVSVRDDSSPRSSTPRWGQTRHETLSYGSFPLVSDGFSSCEASSNGMLEAGEFTFPFYDRKPLTCFSYVNRTVTVTRAITLLFGGAVELLREMCVHFLSFSDDVSCFRSSYETFLPRKVIDQKAEASQR